MCERILLLRFSDSHGIDTIAEHQKTIDQTGSCWWAKIGKQPRLIYLSDYLAQKQRTVFLSSKSRLYSCSLRSVCWKRPLDRFPLYYETEIFDKPNEPHLFFELLNIDEIQMSVLEDYVVCYSHKPVIHDLKKTISSYMFIQHKDSQAASIEKPQKQIVPQKKAKKIVVNDCKYKAGYLCTNKSCVNYQYECLHPKYCIKRK